MRYWWVNQGQTNKQEVGGGYMWSPKRKKGSARNQFYENMREVAPGDVVLSYWTTHIRAWGRILSHGYDSPQPAEFGSKGDNWERIGWRVDVTYQQLSHPVRPATFIDEIRPYLPSKYAPLMAETGLGLNSVYLTQLADPLAQTLIALVNRNGLQIDLTRPTSVLDSGKSDAVVQAWEDRLLQAVSESGSGKTEQQAISMARRGQGLFRQRALRMEPACRITGITNPTYLRASHIKPWRHSSNQERLDPNNGLMLAPHIDHLFDRGFITFSSDGSVHISPVADAGAIAALGINPVAPANVGRFSPQQSAYLEFHRQHVFLAASET